MPLEVVIEFKRNVYQMALTELARFLPRGTHHNRYLRSGMRPHHHHDEGLGYFEEMAVSPPEAPDTVGPSDGPAKLGD